MTDFAVFSQTRISTFLKGRIYFFVFSVFSVARQILLTDRTGVICFFLATQVPDKIKRYFARAMSELKAENAAMIHFYQVCDVSFLL